MPKLDNEKSIRFTVRELLLIKEAVEDVITLDQEITDEELQSDIETNRKLYKEILFKISKKINI